MYNLYFLVFGVPASQQNLLMVEVQALVKKILDSGGEITGIINTHDDQ